MTDTRAHLRLRLEDDLLNELRLAAEDNGITLTAEITRRLQRSLMVARQDGVERRLAEIERKLTQCLSWDNVSSDKVKGWPLYAATDLS